MPTPTTSSQTQIEQIVARILSSRCITRQDQELLLSLSSSTSFSDHEERLVSQVYELLNKGFITVMN